MKAYIEFSHSKHPNLMTKLQHWYYKINYSHAYIRFTLQLRNGKSITLVLHATGMGLHVVSYESFLKKRTPVKIFEVETNAKSFDDFVIDAFNTTGKPYGTKQMLGAGLAKLFRLKRNPFGNVDETFCSKAVGNKLEKFFGFDIPGDPNMWAPKDICEYLENKQKKGEL